MASVLRLVGYEPVESLQFFLSRFPEGSSITELDKELEKVWISHRGMKSLKRFQLSLNDDCFKVECKKAHSNPYTEIDFVFKENLQNHFSSLKILEGILNSMHCCLAEYVLTQCLVLYNWGINSFELVFDNEEFCMRMLKHQNNYKRKRTFNNDVEDFIKWRRILTSQRRKVEAKESKSGDLFEDEERKMLNHKKKRIKRKYSNYRRLERIYKECDKPLGDIQWGKPTNMDIFNKDWVLYDVNQKIWPTKHALSASTPEELLDAIMKVEIKGKTNFGNEVSRQIRGEWKALNRVLGIILKNHEKLLVFDGYGRILKHHLKIKGFAKKITASRKLKPIPASIVSSYIAIIIRKVVPFEFFGSNRARKIFFKEMSRIVIGGKGENFIFKPLIQTLLDAKNNLPWIREIQGCEVARRIISKIVKWMLLDYILLILKNNFYITDVGSSGYRLYYYRKNDVDSAISRWVNAQVQKGNLSLVKGDLDHWTSLEREWLETGEFELNGNDKEIKMPKSTEHIYPVANVRFLPKSEKKSDLRIITSFRTKRTVLRTKDGEKSKLVGMFIDRQVKRLLMFQKLKHLLRFLSDKYGSGIKPLPNNPILERAWMKALHLKKVHGKLYYVKADVSDAFGSILPGLLGAIIEEKLRVKSNQVLQLKKIKECRRKDGGIECGIRKSFSDRPMENKLLVSRSIFVGSRKKLPSCDSAKLKGILDQIISNQYLRINGRYYRMLKGLAQGSAGSISPLLCDIYYSEMDRLYFEEFTTSRECVLLRGVDDYLLLTSDIEKATKFYDIVYNGIKEFNVTFNSGKLKSNIKEESPSSVNYLGLIFDVKYSSVKPDFTRYKTKDILSTMRLGDPYGSMFSRKTGFIRFRSTGISPLKLLPITLNVGFNPGFVVRKTVYAACVIQSNRILALTRHLTRGNDKNDLDVCVILSKTLRKIAAVVTRLNRNVMKFEVCWLFWKAALMVCLKFSGNFRELLAVVRHRVYALEKNAEKSGYKHLLDFLRKDILTWRHLDSTLRAITANSKPSNRFL